MHSHLAPISSQSLTNKFCVQKLVDLKIVFLRKCAAPLVSSDSKRVPILLTSPTVERAPPKSTLAIVNPFEALVTVTFPEAAMGAPGACYTCENIRQ